MSLAEHRYFATAPRGLADLAAREMREQGAAELRAHGTLLEFSGPLETGYRACLWSRVASRVLLRLCEFDAADAQELYAQARSFDWRAHVDPARTLACDFSGSHPAIDDSRFGALRLKDAVCDRLREQTGVRPDIDVSQPAVRLHAHARGTRVTLSLDLAGEGLHRRGYRLEAGEAPLRENLAAGILLRARWDEAAAAGREFLDPLCGSGTLPIEAALIAARRAPGLLRTYYGFLGWREHDPGIWKRLCEEARAIAADSVPSVIRGSDRDTAAVTAARANAQRAQLAELVRFERLPLEQARPLTAAPGLLCTNPPYGERLGSAAQAASLHAELGRVLRAHFAGWDAAILTTTEAARELRLRSYRVHELWNGPLACRLLRVDLAAPGTTDASERRRLRAAQAAAGSGAQMFANRLRKNLRHLARTARGAGVSCYRLYDADMPEYAFAIDRYEESDSQQVHLYVQEYAAPPSVEAQAARDRREQVLAVLPDVTGVPAERIHLRRRERQRGPLQYQRREPRGGGRRLVVAEGGLRFIVNLDDYLDTGLFLDQRLTRARIAAQARGRRFLNLFCYTACASVYAAAGGASATVSVDLSSRYLDWAAENFRLNGLDPRSHRLVRADCLEWLRSAASGAATGVGQAAGVEPFDLIYLDPPTFSNSKRMRGTLDIQRDHSQLIDLCMGLLGKHGLLLFSTNAQRFRLDPQVGERWGVEDLSAATLPFDFVRHPRIHRCFGISRR